MKAFKNEQVENYRKQEKTAWLSFIWELPNLFASLVSAFMAHTIVCWADCVGSVNATLHCFLVARMSEKMKTETGEKYNYGLDRLEIFISFLCDTFSAFGMLVIVVSSVYGLFVPELPSDSLLLFLLLKVVNISFDVYFFFEEKTIRKSHPSRLNESEFNISHNNLRSDFAVGVVVCVCYFFRREMWTAYVSPVFSIIMAILFIFGYLKHMNSSVNELTDLALPLEDTEKILEVVRRYQPKICDVESVNSHQLNQKAIVDITVDMDDRTSKEDQKAFLKAAKEDIREILPECEVRIIIH